MAHICCVAWTRAQVMQQVGLRHDHVGIDALVQQHGSLRKVARVTEIDVGYLSRMRSGEKANPEKGTLERFGLRLVVSYELDDDDEPEGA